MTEQSDRNTCPRCGGPVHRDQCVNPHCRIAELEDQVEALTAELESEKAEVKRLLGVILGAKKMRHVPRWDTGVTRGPLFAMVQLSEDGLELADAKEADHA